ncbi:TspO/MBR-related protein [Venturia nashicola]|nr:TspO/MBR-related protein [Venturia nashicola]
MTSHIASLTLPSFIFANPAVAILTPLALGNAIGFITRPDKTKRKYKELKQPPLNPPAWIFAPVWTALYAGMGYASYRAWTAGMNSSFDPQAVANTKHGATLYTIQLGLNIIWTPLFFVLQRPKEAVADIVTLVGTTSYLIYVWSKVDTTASWLMVPYLGWLSFATYLTIGCGILNDWDFSTSFKKAE